MSNQRHASGSARPHQSSPLASDGLGNHDAETDNEPLGAQAQGQPAEPKAQIIWITPGSPPRPPRPPRKARPQTAPHSSMSPSFDFHQLLPIISRHPEPSTDLPEREAWSDELLPPSFPPDIILPSSPIRHTGFLNRIPKPVQIDEDSISTSSSISQRRPSVPPLHSYTRPSTAPSRDQPDRLSGSTTMRPRLSLLSMTARKPTAEVRSRAKSNVTFSDVAFARHEDGSVDFTAVEKAATVMPLSFTETRSASEMSPSPPVTASTLNDGSSSSFTVYETAEEQEVEVRPTEHLHVGKTRLWEMKDKSRSKAHVHKDEETAMEPRPLPTLLNFGSTPALVLGGSPAKLDVKETTGGRDEKMLVGAMAPKPTPRKAGGAVRRVWRSLVGRA